MLVSINKIIIESSKVKHYKNPIRIPVFVLLTIMMLFITVATFNNIFVSAATNAFAQGSLQGNALFTSNKIDIGLNSESFAPLSDDTFNQLKVLINYQTNDPDLVNTPMDGIMKVYQSDGTLLKTSSIPKGYVVGQSGIIQFATSFTDQTIQNVRAEIYLIDPRDNIISNPLSIKASLTK